MGNAQCIVHNKTHKKVCIITFNQADLMYKEYKYMYILDPGETKPIEAQSDPIGLKVGIVYDAEYHDQILKYKRWQCKKDSTLVITDVVYSANGDGIVASGDGTSVSGNGAVKERDKSAYDKVIDALKYTSPVETKNYRR